MALNLLIYFVTKIVPRPLNAHAAEALTIGGGVVVPVILRSILLAYALSEMPWQRDNGEGVRV
ncbi:hypothetical protein [Roseovarius sp. THAF9]|uniref:hypothetical protein n=1 Tax=Roseovarius sp. THAF9 TaxID=2587847 RepID=UPI0015623DB1|nr:hypothetical protein [Roseovarius sp. THAF9]